MIIIYGLKIWTKIFSIISCYLYDTAIVRIFLCQTDTCVHTHWFPCKRTPLSKVSMTKHVWGYPFRISQESSQFEWISMNSLKRTFPVHIFQCMHKFMTASIYICIYIWIYEIYMHGYMKPLSLLSVCLSTLSSHILYFFA